MPNKKTDMQYKVFSSESMKAIELDGKFYLEGYVNTKNKPDSYGDIPTNYEGKPVYDLTRMFSNPVAFIDHENSASNIAGNWVELKEDDFGLYGKLLLRGLDTIYNDEVKDAVSAYMTGFGRAFSIGGRWYFEDQNNPAHLTKAVIHEISLVGVGADSTAVANSVERPKNMEQPENSEQVTEVKADKVSVLSKASQIKKYMEEQKWV